MKKILTAMSGGVDSAATAGLLLDRGDTVGAATMLLREGGQKEAEDAAAAATAMELPFYLFDWRAAFRSHVIEPFRSWYQQGLTPNPCIFCNRTMKFGLFLDEAEKLGYDGMSTGHYARVKYDAGSGRYLVLRAKDTAKDQSYMLCLLSQQQLSKVVLPLGDYTKAEARQIAAAHRLAVASKHDSQDICFVPDGDYMAFLQADGMIPTPGHFRDETGRDLGPHRGAEAYTLGQRRGLDLPMGQRVYVVGKQGADVIIGSQEALFTKTVKVGQVNWIADVPEDPIECQAKLRYTPKTAKCILHREGDSAFLEFHEPQRAVTPGQAAVFYDGDVVLGGGYITIG